MRSDLASELTEREKDEVAAIRHALRDQPTVMRLSWRELTRDRRKMNALDELAARRGKNAYTGDPAQQRYGETGKL